jgi:hypothetical protein
MLREIDLRLAQPAAGQVDRSQSPVFVVGEPCGCRRLRELLDANSGVSAPPETAWLTTVARATSEALPGLARYGYPEQYWLSAIGRFYDGIQRDFAASRGRTRWSDTAPGLELHLIDRMFPRSQVISIVAERRGRRSGLCRRRGVGSQLSPGRYLEISSGELEEYPQRTLHSVLEFLGEAALTAFQ